MIRCLMFCPAIM